MRVFKLPAVALFYLMLCACDSWSSEKEYTYNLSASPPKGTYSVQIERRSNKYKKDDPWTWKAFFNLTKDGQKVLNSLQIDEGDPSSNTSFPKRPRLNWLQEGILHFSDHSSLPEAESDVLVVSNQSGKGLPYLLVNGAYGERFFLLDLQPGALVKIHALPQWQKGDFRWISASGRLENGTNTYGGQDFKIAVSEKGPGHYCLAIREEQIVIRSREFEGWSIEPIKDDEMKRLKELWGKEEKGSLSESEKEIKRKIWDERKKIIYPREPGCGVFVQGNAEKIP